MATPQTRVRRLLSAVWILAACALADNITTPVSSFESRPDLAPPFMNITLNNASAVSPGYIFLAPYAAAPQTGPYIYDNNGNLVWSGFGSAGPATAHDFHVCRYQGTDHLCLFQGNQMNGYARGKCVIFDDKYMVVNTVNTGDGNLAVDMHEFKMLGDGSSALVTMYLPAHYDLSAYGVSNGQGWIMDGVFEVVDTASKQVLFHWRSLEHVDPSESYVPRSSTDVSGDGLTQNSAWDYFHINSVDKNTDGDYLVSGRHTSTIYKISGADGSIIWKLGGKNSTFTLENFNFTYQHDARFLSENSTTTVISIFDNASNGPNGSSSYSSGKIIAIDNSTNQATLLQSFVAPDGGLLASSQGTFRTLPNGNWFLGWGNNPAISEHDADGNPVFFATFANGGVMNYRAFKANWTGAPVGRPALYMYAHNNTAPTTYYTSWNGATEVADWRFYAASSHNGPFTLVGNTSKIGFETLYTAPGYLAYGIAEAVAANGSGIANSSVIAAFMPGAGLAAACSDTKCPPAM